LFEKVNFAQNCLECPWNAWIEFYATKYFWS